MSVLQGKALPNIDTTKTTTTTGPDFYNTYLTDIAKQGTDAMARTAEQNVAGLTQQQKDAIKSASNITAGDTDLTGARSSLATAGGMSAASAADPYLKDGTATSVSNIQSYLDPYRTNVVDEIGRLGYQNIQSNILPGQTGRSVAGGDFGSRRAESILGQVSRDAARDVLGTQSASLSSGYKSAVDAASRDLQRQIEAAKIAGDTATADATSRRLEAITGKDLGVAANEMGIRNLEQQYKFGEREQKYNQDIMNEPLVTAKNAADLLGNLKVGSTVSEKASAPIPGAYSNSPLSQLAGVGSLFASGKGGQSAIDGVLKSFLGDTKFNDLKTKGLLGTIVGALRGADDTTKEVTNTAAEGEPGFGWKYYTDGTAISPDGVYYYKGKEVWSPDQAAGDDGGGDDGTGDGSEIGALPPDDAVDLDGNGTIDQDEIDAAEEPDPFNDPDNWAVDDEGNYIYVGPG
jgi:hypothetical protein